MRFYKMAIANKEMLKKVPVVEFKVEERVDGGAILRLYPSIPPSPNG